MKKRMRGMKDKQKTKVHFKRKRDHINTSNNIINQEIRGRNLTYL